MNDYMMGSIDACIALSSNKNDFLKNIRKVTGLTTKGINRNTYIHNSIIKHFDSKHKITNRI